MPCSDRFPRAEAGVGSATYGLAIQVGGALGVAVIGSILSTRYQQHLGTAVSALHLPPGELHTITGSLGGALGVASAAGAAGEPLAHTARAAFMSGNHLSLGIGALVSSAAALLVLVALPSHSAVAGKETETTKPDHPENAQQHACMLLDDTGVRPWERRRYPRGRRQSVGYG